MEPLTTAGTVPADSASGPLSAEALGAVHFIGIGGAGMSGIARILLARGLTVSGSDAKDSRNLAALRALGATVHVGHDPVYVDTADTVVVSSAIRERNPELRAARERGVRVIPRAAALAAVMADRQGVAVAGTHGKTTTTSMLTVALQHCGVDPSFVIGGDLNEPGSGAHHGSGDLFVAEADESDGSFLLLSPHGAIVTNVEADHLDHYGDEAAVTAAFTDFTKCIDPSGFLVVCEDDPGARAIGAAAGDGGLEVRTYGQSSTADVRIERLVLHGLTSRFAVVDRGRRLGVVQLAVPGRHYALDPAAALTAGLVLGMPFADLSAGLSTFRGARRRMEFKGVADGVRVYDSYAHHPTELRADIEAARDIAAGGRLVVAFQPHLYSRTSAFADRFGAALGLADEVVVMEVYAAREDPIPGVTGALVANAVPLPAKRVIFEPSWSAVAGHVIRRSRSGDVVLTLGAGDVTMLGPEILAQLETGGPT
jgi:UDP-N-acetylmuramate--alanine ligase